MNDGVQHGSQFLFADNLELHIADRQAYHKKLECSYQSLNDRKFLIPPTKRKLFSFARRQAVPCTKSGLESLMFVKTRSEFHCLSNVGLLNKLPISRMF